MSYTLTGYDNGLPVEIAGTPGKGHTKCDLTFPNHGVGREVARILAGVEDITPDQRRGIAQGFAQLDRQFRQVERWAAHFLRTCVCHCTEEAPE